ncbi:unnamed protein product [Mytilus coruscus]|uniref:Uncharacterized protein n=1 Tax=Mytilus coruscus TaxID=42192 RepID=A0A6J8B4K7_MYTCO|nr:unnamed protein product [Mytilus coruscus]
MVPDLLMKKHGAKAYAVSQKSSLYNPCLKSLEKLAYQGQVASRMGIITTAYTQQALGNLLNALSGKEVNLDKSIQLVYFSGKRKATGNQFSNDWSKKPKFDNAQQGSTFTGAKSGTQRTVLRTNTVTRPDKDDKSSANSSSSSLAKETLVPRTVKNDIRLSHKNTSSKKSTTSAKDKNIPSKPRNSLVAWPLSTKFSKREAFLKKLDNSCQLLGEQELKKTILGVFNSRPPRFKLLPEWNLDKILEMLQKKHFEPMRKAELKFITLKTVFLIACSDLQALRLGDGNISVHSRGLYLIREGLSKQDRPGHFGTKIFVPAFDAEKLLDPKRELTFI